MCVYVCVCVSVCVSVCGCVMIVRVSRVLSGIVSVMNVCVSCVGVLYARVCVFNVCPYMYL